MNAFRMGAQKKICLCKFAVSTSRQGYWYGVIWRVDSDQRLIIKHSFALFVGLCVKCLNSNFWKKLDLEILQVADLSNFASAKQKWHDQNVSQFAVYWTNSLTNFGWGLSSWNSFWKCYLRKYVSWSHFGSFNAPFVHRIKWTTMVCSLYKHQHTFKANFYSIIIANANNLKGVWAWLCYDSEESASFPFPN